MEEGHEIPTLAKVFSQIGFRFIWQRYLYESSVSHVDGDKQNIINRRLCLYPADIWTRKWVPDVILVTRECLELIVCFAPGIFLAPCKCRRRARKVKADGMHRNSL
jgi:hypothetical protein